MVTVAVVMRFMQALLRATLSGTNGLQLALNRTSALWSARMPGEAEDVLQVTVGVDGEDDIETSMAAGCGATATAAVGMFRCVSGGGRAATRVKMANVIKREKSEFMILLLRGDVGDLYVGAQSRCCRVNRMGGRRRQYIYTSAGG